MKRLLGLLLGGAAVVAMTQSVWAQDDYLARRQNLMKNFSAESKAIKAAVEKKEYNTVAIKAKDIAGNLDMANFAKHWPHNSTDAKSKARPEIWSKWNDFMMTAWDGQQRALALSEAANAKNDGRVDEAFKSFGQICGNCHKPFRADTK